MTHYIVKHDANGKAWCNGWDTAMLEAEIGASFYCPYLADTDHYGQWHAGFEAGVKFQAYLATKAPAGRG